MVVIDIEVEGFDELAREFADTEPRVQREMPRIMRKAGVNIKDEWNAAASRSRHFRIAGTVTFDENLHFGAMHEVEVGPDRSVGRRAGKRSGPAGLAGIAHFGGANGGGGTLGDPQRFADAEGPRLEQAMSDLVDKVLGK